MSTTYRARHAAMRAERAVPVAALVLLALAASALLVASALAS